MWKKLFLAAAVLSLGLSPAFAAETAAPVYKIDPVHSNFGFAVKHMQVSTVRGAFDAPAGTIQYDPADLSTFKADVTIPVDSINTNNQRRDAHLKSGDFFDAAQFPSITFQSSRLEKRGAGTVLIGDLTMRGVTKQLTIPVTINGPVTGMGGKKVIGLDAQITVNRQDFGISWSKQLDNGGLVVADNVDLIINIEADNQG